MDGTVRSPIDAGSERVLHEVHDRYDMNQHTRAGSPQAARLTAEFVDRFGIVGPPEHCVARLRALSALGVDRFIVVGPSMDAEQDEARLAQKMFVGDVLPVIREVTDAP